MLLVVVPLTAPVEVVFWELLVPRAWLRWVPLVLGAYSVLWLLGLYALRVALPHRLEPDGLRQGIFAEVFVPYAEVEGVERERRRAPKNGDGLRSSPDEDAAYLAMASRVDLALAPKSPLTVRGFSGPVRTVHPAADDPGGMLKEIRRRLEPAPTPTPR